MCEVPELFKLKPNEVPTRTKCYGYTRLLSLLWALENGHTWMHLDKLGKNEQLQWQHCVKCIYTYKHFWNFWRHFVHSLILVECINAFVCTVYSVCLVTLLHPKPGFVTTYFWSQMPISPNKQNSHIWCDPLLFLFLVSFIFAQLHLIGW
jgi:hypothetical protein